MKIILSKHELEELVQEKYGMPEGTEVEIDYDALPAEEKQFLRLFDEFKRDEQKIPAIKLVRQVTGFSLKEAKAFCDTYFQCDGEQNVIDALKELDYFHRFDWTDMGKM